MYNLYSSPNSSRVIKSRRMGWVGHVVYMWDLRNMYKILVEKPEGKRLLGRLRCSWEDNIKFSVRETGFGVVN
jgi:hypothetical protein